MAEARAMTERMYDEGDDGGEGGEDADGSEDADSDTADADGKG